MKRRLLLLAFAAAAVPGCAKTTAQPEVAVPPAQTAPLEYRSAFTGYQAFRDEPVAPWRDANETVREAAEHPKEPAKPSAPPEHRGHR